MKPVFDSFTEPQADRRKFLLGLLFCSAAGLAAARRPTKHLDYLGHQRLDELVPKSIGRWKFVTASGLVVPPNDELSNALYSQQLTRVYSDGQNPPIMLLLAQNGSQTGFLQVHRPETCYTAGGYQISELARHPIRLGSKVLVANSIDASSDRDFAATFHYACSMTMIHLSRLAEDLIILCGEGHRFFELSDALSTGSSMMPQKKNPDPLELVRGKTGRSIGHLMALLTAMKGLPSGYNKDLQEDKEAIFDAEDTLAACLAAVRAIVDGVTLNRGEAEAAATGMLLATDVADYLVRRGLPFRRAHEVSGALVRKLLAEGREFDSLSLKEWRAASDLFGEDIAEHITAQASVAAKRTPQSTAPAAVARSLSEVQAWLSGMTG